MNVLVLILLISWSLVGLTVASDKFSEILATDLEILTQDFINSIKKEDSYDLQNFSKRQKRSETISSQTVYQFQKKQRKCKNLKSYGIASGSNALSYMSFVASVITLVLNINNNINANNNNNNQANVNFGNNNNLVSNLNQNVGNNFNLMFPPGKRRRRDVDKMFSEYDTIGKSTIKANCYLW